MARINRNQKIFLSAEYLFNINPLEKYQILFDHLNTSALNEHHQGSGRHQVPKTALHSSVASRLLTLCMQDPSVRRVSPQTANQCTIAPTAVLLIALTASKTGHNDMIRFIKNFLPNLLFCKTSLIVVTIALIILSFYYLIE
jgi:hypothetical protein